MTMPPPPPPMGDYSMGMPMGAQAATPDYASWGQRVLAALIDYIPVAILQQVLGRIGGIGALFSLIGLALSFYFSFLTGSKGASPGKRVMGIQVVNMQTGQFIGGGGGILRSLAHILDLITCGIGFLFPLWDKQKQTLADKVMKTVVVSGPKEDFVSAFKSAIPSK